MNGEAGQWRGLGLSEAQHRRIVDYLVGVPHEQVTQMRRAFEVGA
ncbi:hypothetical protein ACQPWW_05875 [Micromonospora sp. CA-240977]